MAVEVVAVSVPAAAVGLGLVDVRPVNLHQRHARFDQPPREQHLSAELIVQAIQGEFAAWQGDLARRDDVTAIVFKLIN